MDTEQLFYTQNGYDRADTGPLTTAMEDYLEMITRIVRENGYASDAVRRLYAHLRAGA